MNSSFTAAKQQETSIVSKEIMEDDCNLTGELYKNEFLETSYSTATRQRSLNHFNALLAAAYLSIESITSTDQHNELIKWQTYQVDEETKKISQYVASIFSFLNELTEFRYQPGYDNPIRDYVLFESFNESEQFVDAIQDILRNSNHLLSEDIQLEIIDTLGDIDNISFKQKLIHLLTTLLRSKSISIVDASVSALSNNNLNARQAIPYLRSLAGRTSNRFLEEETLKAVEVLERN